MFCIIQTNISKQRQKIKRMETLPYDKVLMKSVFKTDFLKPGVGESLEFVNLSFESG